MKYIFKYTVVGYTDCSTCIGEYESDCFSSALADLAVDLAKLPISSSVSFNTYYRANNDYRKFRERVAFERLINLRGVYSD